MGKIEANLNDLPNIEGLKEFVAADEESDTVAKKTKDDAAGSEKREVLTADGKAIQFKTLEDAFRAYQETQAFAARIVAEKKDLEQKLEGLQEQMESLRYQAPTASQQIATEEDFDASFVKNPKQAIEATVTEKLLTARIADVLAEEQAKDKDNFMERYQYAQRVVHQIYPHLAQTPAGIRKAFEYGDRLRADEARQNAERVIKLTLGEDVDLEKFKALVKKDQSQKTNTNLAYMPDTSLHSRSRSQSEISGSKQLNDAVAKGDIDAVIAGTFQSILAQT